MPRSLEEQKRKPEKPRFTMNMPSEPTRKFLNRYHIVISDKEVFWNIFERGEAGEDVQTGHDVFARRPIRIEIVPFMTLGTGVRINAHGLKDKFLQQLTLEEQYDARGRRYLRSDSRT